MLGIIVENIRALLSILRLQMSDVTFVLFTSFSLLFTFDVQRRFVLS